MVKRINLISLAKCEACLISPEELSHAEVTGVCVDVLPFTVKVNGLRSCVC